ncbi:conserved hypothetical protein [Cupriavidus taiwanensis]|uniref:hypothetical protein n=1 Tax=Cupriavidus taiwanensis TaxID=164546 RepID=UPI000E12D861|nr:hypothetical protein [Cupriavidus taiwanensis]SPA23691.1 conserved hypothetical protein [Cupriavidus taiwanensis]
MYEGRYSIGKTALKRATNDRVPPDLLQAMRQVIARGDIPRVAVIGGIWEWPPQMMGRQDADGDL